MIFEEIAAPNPAIYNINHIAIKLLDKVEENDDTTTLYKVEVFKEDGSSQFVETTFKQSTLDSLTVPKSEYFRLTLNNKRWSVVWLQPKS